jgi:hypothetical protein
MTELMTYSNPRTSATFHDWPSGAKKVTADFFIETHPTRGERAVRVTTGAPKKLTYARKMRIVDGSDGRTYIAALTRYRTITIMRGDMKYHHGSCLLGEPRYAELLELFK